MEENYEEFMQKFLETSSINWMKFYPKLPFPLSHICKLCSDIERVHKMVMSHLKNGLFPPIDYFAEMQHNTGQIIRIILSLCNERLADEEDKKAVIAEYADVVKKMEDVEKEVKQAYSAKTNPDLLIHPAKFYLNFIHSMVKPLIVNTIKNVQDKYIEEFIDEVLFQSGIAKEKESEEVY